MIIGLSLLIALIGVLLYALAGNPKNSELGCIMFFCGLLAFLLGANAGGLNVFLK